MSFVKQFLDRFKNSEDEQLVHRAGELWSWAFYGKKTAVLVLSVDEKGVTFLERSAELYLSHEVFWYFVRDCDAEQLSDGSDIF